MARSTRNRLYRILPIEKESNTVETDHSYIEHGTQSQSKMFKILSLVLVAALSFSTAVLVSLEFSAPDFKDKQRQYINQKKYTALKGQ